MTARIYSIDDTLGSVTGESETKIHFTKKSDTLELRFWDGTKVDVEPSPRPIDLLQFIKNHPKIAIDAQRF